MTLVELLVVVAIMVLLLAVSVPMLRPMLESQKTSNAAQVLAGAFKHARTKAIHEQRGYGIRLIPFETAPNTAVQLHLQKSGTAITDVVNPPEVRVKVEDGVIIPYRFQAGVWKQTDWTGLNGKVLLDFEEGYRIQFNRLGRSLKYSEEDGGFKLDSPYDKLNLPEDDLGNDAMEYRISKQEEGVSFGWLPPIVMPRGTIVDLAFSGGEDDKVVPLTFSPGDEVIVMFSPAGYVDQLHVIRNGEWEEYKVNEALYFCVGDWDRQVDANGNTLAEDGKSNLAAPATYWVTLHPKTGGVRIAENAPVRATDSTERLREARKFAREHYFNVGGL